MPHEEITYRRAKLYDQVWAKPVRTVAKRHGISDVALAKICRKMGVPLPPRGYWARKAAGQDLERPPLPQPIGGIDEKLTVHRWRPDHPYPTPGPPVSRGGRADRGSDGGGDR